MEKWLPISGFDGLYSISNRGRVRAEPNVSTRVIRGKKVEYKKRRKILAAQGGSIVGCYNHVTLYKSNYKPRQVAVHILVLTAFRGKCPKGLEARHVNGNKNDNRLSNLFWSTHKRNCADRIAHGTHPIGSMHKHAKLDERKVAAALRGISGGAKYEAIANFFRVSRGTIQLIALGHTWKHVPRPGGVKEFRRNKVR